MAFEDTPLQIGSHTFRSRLIVGTGKYETLDLMKEALEASGTEMVTVALRRVDLSGKTPNLLDYIDTNRYTILPNTAGCYTVEDAVKVAHLARELELGDLIKVEVIGDEKTLMPDPLATVEATKILAGEGYTVMAYCSDDIVLCKRLEEAGAAVVMPLGSPIGSGRGILNPANVRLILEQASVPIIVDAGVGVPSDVAIAMELGVDGVLLNTGIAKAKDPVRMAEAMKLASHAGRLGYVAGRIEKRAFATASSPIKDF
jgi:thiazole synthase